MEYNCWDNIEKESRDMAAQLTRNRDKLRERFEKETGFLARETRDAMFTYEYTLWLEDQLVNK